MNNFIPLYGYTLLVLGLIISLYALMKQILTPESRTLNGIHQSKWNQLALLGFLSLSLMGTLILFLDYLPFNLFEYNLWDYSHNWIIDFILIFHIFVAYFLIIRGVEMQTNGERAGKFTVSISSENVAKILLIFLPADKAGFGYLASGLFLFMYLAYGCSILLVFLSLIPIYLTKKVFLYAPAH